MQKGKIVLSTLAKTWIFDLDGTLVKHNGYKTEEGDSLLSGVKEYFQEIPREDKIVIFTSRTTEYREETLKFLKNQQIRYDAILFDMPVGERVVINDRKPSGLDMAFAFNIDRNVFDLPEITRER